MLSWVGRSPHGNPGGGPPFASAADEAIDRDASRDQWPNVLPSGIRNDFGVDGRSLRYDGDLGEVDHLVAVAAQQEAPLDRILGGLLILLEIAVPRSIKRNQRGFRGR